MATLGDLALLAGLGFGVHQKRRDASSARRQKEAQFQTEAELARQKLLAAMMTDQQQAAAQGLKPFEEALYGPNAADIQHGIAQQGPQSFEAFLKQAEGAYQAAGRPVDLSAMRITPPAAPPPPSSAEHGPFGASMDYQQPAPFDLADAYRKRYQPSAKTQATAQRVDAYGRSVDQRAPLIEQQARRTGVQADVLEATMPAVVQQAFAKVQELTARGDLMGAQAELARATELFRQAQTQTEQQRPGLVKAQTQAYRDLPGSRAAGRQVTMRGQDISAETARRGQDMGAETARAQMALRKQLEASNLDPLRKLMYQQNFDTLMNRASNPLTGQQVWQYDEAERQKALQGLTEMAAQDGLSLTGIGLQGVPGGGGGAPTPSAGPAAGALPAGVTEAQVQAVSGLSSAEYNAAFSAATPEEKALLKAARAAALKRRGKR